MYHYLKFFIHAITFFVIFLAVYSLLLNINLFICIVICFFHIHNYIRSNWISSDLHYVLNVFLVKKIKIKKGMYAVLKIYILSYFHLQIIWIPLNLVLPKFNFINNVYNIVISIIILTHDFIELWITINTMSNVFVTFV